MKLLWMFLATQLTSPISALYHEKSLKIFRPPDVEPPLSNSSNFGYSVAYQSSTKSLIVGAPTANSFGVILSCDIEKSRNCSVIKNSLNRANSNYSHDYWLGATVKSGPNYFVTCAPRYVELSYTFGLYSEFSRCYKSLNGSTLTQLSQIDYYQRANKALKPEEQWDSFGWSIDIKDDTFLFGGPAMFTGRAMEHKPTKTTSVNGYKKGVNVKYNFGYSVAIGNFFMTEVIYAVGSPFGQNGKGKVVLFDKHWNVKGSVLNDDVGSMFSAVLATAQISGPLSDLLVGAPAKALKHTYNIGEVYYYKTGRYNRITKQSTIKPEKIITGHQTGSFFGSAIISVGDLNGDGKDEIAIAAPYEDDGKGAVYLYCGSTFLEPSASGWLQRLQQKGLHTFGLSLTAPSDYDQNGCNELAVGAPEDNTVVLYKCMASVVVKVSAIFPNLQDRGDLTKPHSDLDETYFIFKSCLDVKYPQKLITVIASLEVNVLIYHPEATLAKPEDEKYIVSLHKDKTQYCRDIRINTPKDGNYTSTIFYNITTRLLNSPVNESDFDAHRVILSQLSELSTSGNIWAAKCKVQGACKPDLSMEIVTSPPDSYTIGSKMPLTVNLKVRNEGEAAYDSCMELRVEGVSMRKTPTTSCDHVPQSNKLKCTPSHALKTNKTWETTEIFLNTEGLTNKNKLINITARVYDHCINPTKFKEQNKTIKLDATSSGITVKGKTSIGEVVTMTSLEVTKSGKHFEHNYYIQNKGLFDWVDVLCQVTLPKLAYVTYTAKPVKVIMQQIMSDCDISDNTDLDKTTVNCNLSKIPRNIINDVVVYIQVPPNTLDEILYKQNVTIETTVKLYFDDDIKSYSVETVVILRDTNIPWWIIFLAAIIGLIILIIIVLILRQCGFLKRKEKKKLEKLRNSVRRQTIRRSAMQQQAEDRQRLTEVPAEPVEITPCRSEVDRRIDVN